VKLYLNAGFGEPLGSMIPIIKGLGFDGIRQDIKPGMEVELLEEFVGSGLRPLCLVNGGKMPEDPEHAACMQDGEVDFFNNDPFHGVRLHRA